MSRLVIRFMYHVIFWGLLVACWPLAFLFAIAAPAAPAK